MGNPKCYECVYRRNVPGDAHSACGLPLVNTPETSGLAMAAVMHFGGFSTKYLTVRFNRHGVQNGWALYPANFDPIWLEDCTGFLASAPAETAQAQGAAR